MSENTDDPYRTPPPVIGAEPAQAQGDGTGGLVPYKNPSALTAYYLSVFSLIPCIGLLLGIPAVVLGFRGLKFQKENPHASGVAHAWVGIILGGLTSLTWLALIVLFITGAIMSNR